MDWSWLWQGFASHWAILIFSFLGSALMAWWKAYEGKWNTPILYGLVTFACLVFLLSQFKLMSQWDTKPINIATLPSKQLEIELREVMDLFGYKTGSNPDTSMDFRFTVTDLNGANLNVYQQKSSPSIIVIAMTITVPPEIRNAIAKLSKKEQQQFFRESRMLIDGSGLLRENFGPPLADSIRFHDTFLKSDLENRSIFAQKVRHIFLTHYALRNILSSFIDQ